MRLAWHAAAFLVMCVMGSSGASSNKKCGYCMGDPHCLTFDGLEYDCQMDGTFNLVSVEDTETTVDVTFVVPDGKPYSLVTRVVAQEGSSPSIDITATGGNLIIMYDGVLYEGFLQILTGVVLQYRDDGFVMLFDSGVEVVVTAAQLDGGSRNNMHVWAFVLPTMDTMGLLANNNRNVLDDVEEEVAEHCPDYTNLEIVGEVPADVAEACGGNVQCIYDGINIDVAAGIEWLTVLRAFESYVPACPPGVDICDDPHMRGLRGQKIEVSGVDGGWYCLVRDDEIDLHVNVRFTAPLPDEFPDRQLITGLAVLSEGHSLVIEVKDPYSANTTGCPSGVSPCLADGGLRIVVNGAEVDALLAPTRDEITANGMTLSASNLPAECRMFGGDEIWASMYAEMLQGTRELAVESFEDWVMKFDTMAAQDWCARYIAERGLLEVQSSYAVLKISTPSVEVRLHAGVNHQGGDGELDWDGRVLPDLKFWQMNAGLEGLDLDHETLSGLLGETARLVYVEGRPVMNGDDAFRGTVEDYRVSGPVGTDFALRNSIP